jgi:nickel-dependent lactate racemase
MLIERYNKNGPLETAALTEAIAHFFDRNDYTGKRLLLLIPDNTRSGPVGQVFKHIFDCLHGKVSALDLLVALGTHQPMTEQKFCTRLEITPAERKTKYASVKFFNHEWQRPETFTRVGTIPPDQIEQLTDGLFCEQVSVTVNKLIFTYDELFIIGPVFPHEVVGFSGGHKYIFPGIAGAEIINFFHWLGAVHTNLCVNGHIWTAPRRVVEKAASLISLPRKLFALVSLEDKLKGIFIGDCLEAWQKAAALSEKLHIVYKTRPYATVLGIAPRMYDDLWTAGKVMYKLEPVVADGGTLIIYAPHITEFSRTHGKIIEQIGYHTRDYFLKQMPKFAHVPRAVLAHCTHVKGIGTFDNGIEKPRINVVLATGISRQRCENANLGYLDPDQINITDYENNQDQGILLVHNAGEILYRLTAPDAPPANLPEGEKNGSKG